MPKLVINAGTAQAREFDLKHGTYHIGRAEGNDIRIEDGSVSSNHARIVVEGEVIRLKDLGSTNGTFINRSQVKEGFVRPGQIILLGSVELLMEGDGATTPVAATLPPPDAAPAAPAPNSLRYAAPIAAKASAPAPALAAAPTAVVAAPVERLVEPPKGKTACKFHRNAAGQWLCQQCNELFCSLCVITRRTEEGPGFFCRKCGTQCVPVKVKLVKKKEKELKVHSDGVVLARSVGFAFAGAVLGAAIWIGLSKAMGFDVPFIFCPLAGFLCGYAVKLVSQDRPGAIFSSIASVFCVISCAAGKLGMIWATGLNTYSTTSLLTSFAGLAIGLFLAWKFGGGDF
jgi:hypothetical protein